MNKKGIWFNNRIQWTKLARIYESKHVFNPVFFHLFIHCWNVMYIKTLIFALNRRKTEKNDEKKSHQPQYLPWTPSCIWTKGNEKKRKKKRKSHWKNGFDILSNRYFAMRTCSFHWTHLMSKQSLLVVLFYIREPYMNARTYTFTKMSVNQTICAHFPIKFNFKQRIKLLNVRMYVYHRWCERWWLGNFSNITLTVNVWKKKEKKRKQQCATFDVNYLWMGNVASNDKLKYLTLNAELSSHMFFTKIVLSYKIY